MCDYSIFLCVLLLPVFVVTKPNDKGGPGHTDIDFITDDCHPECPGQEYECVNGKCVCAPGYIENYFHTGCLRCPGQADRVPDGLGERCFGSCCYSHGNTTLQCWHGFCQSCYDAHGNWKCRDVIDQMWLVSSTQLVMGTALVLGIVATLVLIFKLAATSNIRPMGSGSATDGRLSIGSLQMYVEERLRDPPPRYSRATPIAAVTISPPAAYRNDGFIHDTSTIPPPPYTEAKPENNQNTAMHI